MRNEPPFSCPACGTASPEARRCATCGGPVVDARGLRPQRPAALRGTGNSVVDSIWQWWGDRATRRRIAVCRERAGFARAISDTSDGVVAVRGHVRVLRGVRAPDGLLVAAFRRWQLVDARTSLPPPSLAARRTGQRWIEEDGACGVFLVDDGSGVALVDDDAFDLEAIEGAPASSASDGTRVLREGELVEVIGAARRAPPPPELVGTGRVDASPLLTFDGGPDARILLLALPLSEPLPLRRFKSIGPSRPGSPVTREREALSQLEAAGRAQAEARPRTDPER